MKQWRIRPLAFALQTSLLGLALSGMASATEVPATSTPAVKEVHVAPGSLAHALNQFAQQSGVLLSYDPDLTKDKQSAGLQGRYTVDQGVVEQWFTRST